MYLLTLQANKHFAKGIFLTVSLSLVLPLVSFIYWVFDSKQK